MAISIEDLTKVVKDANIAVDLWSLSEMIDAWYSIAWHGGGQYAMWGLFGEEDMKKAYDNAYMYHDMYTYFLKYAEAVNG